MSELYTVEADIPLTRMRRFHLVSSPDGQAHWRSQKWGEVIEWLNDREQRSFWLDIDGEMWLCHIQPPAPQRRPT